MMRLTRFMTATAIAAALAIPATSFAQPSTAPNPAAPATSPTAPSTTTAPKAITPDTAPKAAAPATGSQAARHIGADQMRASKLIGAAVYDQGDQKLGSIADLVVDRDGRVSDVVIGLGDKNVGIKMADLKHGKDNHLTLNATKDALKQMATFDLSAEAPHSGSSTQR